MNICKHCGFTGEPEDFRYPRGTVCKECYKKQKCEQANKRYRDKREEVKKQQKKYQENNKNKISKGKKENYKNNHEQQLKKQNKYYQNNRKQVLENSRIKRRKKGILPWTEIKHLRLGLYIEKVIASMFGSVTESIGNPDVDFVCAQGYKMQVKVSSKHFNQNKSPNWGFNIKKNKVVDYFILVAVNNSEDIDKEDFEPEHIWMIKGNVLNNKTKTSIALSRVSKWDKYSIMEEYKNRFIECCNIIKEKK